MHWRDNFQGRFSITVDWQNSRPCKSNIKESRVKSLQLKLAILDISYILNIQLYYMLRLLQNLTNFVRMFRWCSCGYQLTQELFWNKGVIVCIHSLLISICYILVILMNYFMQTHTEKNLYANFLVHMIVICHSSLTVVCMWVCRNVASNSLQGSIPTSMTSQLSYV